MISVTHIMIIGIIILCTVLSSVSAESANNTINESIAVGNTSVNNSNSTSGISEIDGDTENSSISLKKGPKTDLIYAEEMNSTVIIKEEGNITIENGENTSSLNAENTTNMSSKYNSLADIIKAQDWNALSEYKCKIKTENPSSFDNSDITLSDKQSRWDSRFTGPAPVVVIPSCCG